MAKDLVGQQDIDQSWVRSRLILIRETVVILDEDLAVFFGTETREINQYRGRNARRFPPDYAFQLTRDEWAALKSQNVISKGGRGGRRTPPWAYSEPGVAMMSMGIRSAEAEALADVIIDTFVQFRRGSLPKQRVLEGPKADALRQSFQQKIYDRMAELLDQPMLPSGNTLRQELGDVGTSALDHIKQVLAKPGKQNEKISAEIGKILAETEKIYAEATKTRLEAEAMAIQNARNRLSLMRDLREMAAQLERDDWANLLDPFSDPEHVMLELEATPIKRLEEQDNHE